MPVNSDGVVPPPSGIIDRSIWTATGTDAQSDGIFRCRCWGGKSV